MINYKIDVLWELKIRGFSTYTIKKNKLLGGATLDRITKKEPISMQGLDQLCRLLQMQPGDILEYVDETVQIPEDKECTSVEGGIIEEK